jgi:hypothetical protein
VLECRGRLESIRKSEGRLESRLEGSTRAVVTTKYYIGDKKFMTTLKNKELLGFSNMHVSEKFGRSNSTKIYSRNKNNRFRAFYIKTRNLLYKQLL